MFQESAREGRVNGDRVRGQEQVDQESLILRQSGLAQTLNEDGQDLRPTKEPRCVCLVAADSQPRLKLKHPLNPVTRLLNTIEMGAKDGLHPNSHCITRLFAQGSVYPLQGLLVLTGNQISEAEPP